MTDKPRPEIPETDKEYWTPARIAEAKKDRGWSMPRMAYLKYLWEKCRCSGSEVAIALGGLSASAVIGKVDRLGLSGGSRKPGISAGAPQRERVHPGRKRDRVYEARERALAGKTPLAGVEPSLAAKIVAIEPAKPRGPVIPLHQSDAFPKDLPEADRLSLARLYQQSV